MGNHFQVGTSFLSPLDRGINGDGGNDGWDTLELEFEEFLTTLYTFLYGDESRKALWDHEHL
jgi:hypothetical protein